MTLFSTTLLSTTVMPLGLGCAPDPGYASHHAQTFAACELEPGAPELRAGDVRLASEGCVDAIADDFGVDLDAMVEADGLPDAYGLVRGDDRVWRSRLGLVLLNAHALLVGDFGDLDAVEPSLLVSPALIDELEAVSAVTGSRAVGPLLYDLTASVIRRTKVGHREGARATFVGRSRTLFVTLGTGDVYVSGGLLVHEARHLWESHGACPWARERSCDADIDGAYGFGMSAKLLRGGRVETPAWRAGLRADVRQLSHHIAAFNDEEGKLLPWVAEELALD